MTRALGQRQRWFRRALVALAVAAVMLPMAWEGYPHLIAYLIVGRVPIPRFEKPDLPYRPFTFQSQGATFSGWLFMPKGKPKGLVIHLHGRMYTRVGGIATADALVPQGYAVLTYDQRAHGDSGGDDCTYGKLETRDLAAAISAVGIFPVFVVGHSLGAAVALQAAATDPRIRAVVAASCFADLRTAITGRAPELHLWNEARMREVISLAEHQAGFSFDDISPLRAAAHIHVPVLVVQGALDTTNPPENSRRIFDALAGPKQLLMVKGAAHTDVLDPGPVWTDIVRFIEKATPRQP